MTPEPSESLAGRLSQRKLVQWTLAYLAGAWVALQVFSLLGDAFAWPPAVIRIVTVLLGVGLVLALVLAWYHGERGEQRVTGMELAIFAMLAVATGVGVIMVRGEPALASAAPASASPLLFQIITSSAAPVSVSAGAHSPIAISRDGSMVAFMVESQGIYLRRMDEVEAHLIRGSELGQWPNFSPDGKSILFRMQDGELRRIATQGGSSVALARGGFEQSWGDDDQVVFGRDGSLWRVSARGGEPTLVAGPDSLGQHAAYGLPYVLPGSQAALITLWKSGSPHTSDFAQLGIVSLVDGKVTELGISGTKPIYTTSGHLVFARADGTVFAAPFSLRRLRPTGPEFPVLEGVTVGILTGDAYFTVSDGGLLLYIAAPDVHARLLLVDRRGVARTLTTEARLFRDPRVSPDGRRIAVSVGNDVWIYDVASATLSRLSTDGESGRPEWSADGKRIASIPRSTGGGRISWRPWDGSGSTETYAEDPGGAEISLGPPGTFVAVRRGALPAGKGDIWIAPVDSPQVFRPFVATPANEAEPQISPDGRLLAYTSYESGRAEVYVRPLSGPGPRVQASNDGGAQPVWSRDGGELFYRGSGRVMAATLTRSPELGVARRDALFIDPYAGAFVGGFTPGHQTYDVTPAGDFVMLEPVTGAGVQFFGIANWFEELRRRGNADVAGRVGQ